jgi:hypothetical protein
MSAASTLRAARLEAGGPQGTPASNSVQLKNTESLFLQAPAIRYSFAEVGRLDSLRPGRFQTTSRRRRLTFLSHFTICLGCVALAFFATVNGVPQIIFREDQSMMTSVIAALFVGTAVYLGWLAWNVSATTDAGFGHLAERLAVMIGFVGTAMGLSLQAKALAAGSASFEALATSLFTTVTGGAAAALIAIMTYSLEAGVQREKRDLDNTLETPR